MWMSNWQGFAGWHVRELPGTWFELFLYGVRGLLSPGASRVCPFGQWEQSLQMSVSRQMQCHTCHWIDLSCEGCVVFVWGTRGVKYLNSLPPWDCRVWGRLRWMWMWMLWQLRMATASTAQPAQSVLQATRRSCVRAAHQTSFLRVSAASNAPKRLISVQPRPSLHLSLHWSLRLVQSFGYGCGGQFKPNNLQALQVHWWNKWRLKCRSCCNFVTRRWLSFFVRQWDPSCFVFFDLHIFAFFFQVKIFSFHLQVNWWRSALGCFGGVGRQYGWEELWKVAILGASLCPDHPIFSLKPEGCLQFAVSIWSLGWIFWTKKNLLQHKFHKAFQKQPLDWWVMPHVLQILSLDFFLEETWGHKTGTVEQTHGASFWFLLCHNLSLISPFWGWCHCSHCLRLGGASVSIGCLPLLPAGGSRQAWIGHRWWAAGPRMFGLFGCMKLGETPLKGGWNLVIYSRRTRLNRFEFLDWIIKDLFL